MKFYSIEQQEHTVCSRGYMQYRYRSLFNGAVGTWCYKQKNAIEEGEDHRELILFLHGKTIIDEEK